MRTARRNSQRQDLILFSVSPVAMFIILANLCFLEQLLCAEQLELQLTEKKVPALYVFGDSLIDSGNNNYITKSRANCFPYGVDFDGGRPTGRFTNGKTVADFIAIGLGLPLAPPYLGLSELQRNNITTGINFASAGCGILPETGIRKDNLCLSFDKQAELFLETVDIHLTKQFQNKRKIKRHLSESLFLISFGVNDYFNNDGLDPNVTAQAFAQFLLNQFSIRLERLYNLGARKFLVNNIPPAGCFPPFVVKKGSKIACDEDKNKMVTLYNTKLPRMLQLLQTQLPASVFLHSDYFKFQMELRASASKFGIKEIWEPCCPNCQRYHAIPCKRRDTYVFFDASGHPTQIVNEIYANYCFNEVSVCSPLNLSQLCGNSPSCLKNL